MTWTVTLPGQPHLPGQPSDILASMTPCFELSGPKRKGYVRFGLGNSREDGRVFLSAHRVAWMAVNGPIPAGGQVLHRCDNRACIRADHLYLGNNDDNVRDRVLRLRSYSKLSASDVAEVRRLYAPRGKGGLSGVALARRYGVSPAAISLAVNGYTKGTGAGRQ